MKQLLFLLSLSIAITAISFTTKAETSMDNSQTPVVLELFTSQSCSSCPAADSLVKKMSENDSGLLVLSYHVDYWDHLNWKDTYSSSLNTQRQRNYAQSLGSNQVFTPQLIVNGTDSMVSSNQSKVTDAINKAKQSKADINLSIKALSDKLKITITPQNSITGPIDLWQVSFDRYAKTQVKSGENGGRTLESINNVTSIKYIGAWTPRTDKPPIMIEAGQKDGVAILAQAPHQGKILGAAVFYNPVK